jgi:hypothetical protein
MGGTVTLVKVISPATIARTTLAVPTPGHKMVAVILTVHSPTSSAANFGIIYVDSKLRDSNGQGHIAKREGKYQVTQCLTYAPFKAVAAGGSQTGCELFILPLAATPVELKLSGKAEADFKIVAGPASAPFVPAPRVKAPLTEGLGSSSPTTSTTFPGETPTTLATGSGATTTTGVSPGSTAHQVHHHGQSGQSGQSLKPPVISHVNPSGGLVGQKVEILGKHLLGTTMVTFSGVPATIAKKGKSKITTYVPLGATSGPVVVYTQSGNVTSGTTFAVL